MAEIHNPKSRPQTCKCGGALTESAIRKRMYRCAPCEAKRRRDNYHHEPAPPTERPQPSMPVLRWLERPMQ
jgi:hypothetical protein